MCNKYFIIVFLSFCIHNVIEGSAVSLEKDCAYQFEDKITKMLSAWINEMDNKLAAVNRNIQEKLLVLENKINGCLESNLEHRLNALDKKIPNNLEEKLKTMEKNIHDTLEKTIEPKLNALEKLEMNALKEIDRMFCKEQIVRGSEYKTPLYHMDNVTYDHIRRKKNGSLTEQFEMQVAIKAVRDGHIMLSAEPNGNTGSTEAAYSVYEILVGAFTNTLTILRKNNKIVISIDTPKILSSTEYALFYIKISDGRLEFGKEGSSPLITYSNSDLNKLEYFGFASWDKDEAKFLYDCPNWHHEIV